MRREPTLKTSSIDFGVSVKLQNSYVRLTGVSVEKIQELTAHQKKIMTIFHSEPKRVECPLEVSLL